LYIRFYKPEGYFQDDDIYFAIYLRKLTANKLKRVICDKLAVELSIVKDVFIRDSFENTSLISDGFVRSLRSEQTLEIDFEWANQHLEEAENLESLQMSIIF